MNIKNDFFTDELEEMLRLGHNIPASKNNTGLSAPEAEGPASFFTAENDGEEPPTVALEAAQDDAKSGYFLVQMKNNRGFELSKPEMLCGCGSDCDIIIPQEASNHRVSRKHCLIMQRYGKVYVKDVSKNGTFAGEFGSGTKGLTRLIPKTETEIRPGQVLSLAGELFTLLRKEG